MAAQAAQEAREHHLAVSGVAMALPTTRLAMAAQAVAGRSALAVAAAEQVGAAALSHLAASRSAMVLVARAAEVLTDRPALVRRAVLACLEC